MARGRATTGARLGIADALQGGGVPLDGRSEARLD
jgi:hypothetical protein